MRSSSEPHSPDTLWPFGFAVSLGVYIAVGFSIAYALDGWMPVAVYEVML